MPGIGDFAKSFPVEYKENPGFVTDRLFDILLLTYDELLWVQFLRALNTRLINHRRRFVTDEEWSDWERELGASMVDNTKLSTE